MPPLLSPRALVLLLVLVAFVSHAVAETATIHGVSRIYLRTGPGTSYEPDGVVVEGEPLTALEPAGSWTKVETADGRVGYVYGGYLRYGASEPSTVENDAEPAAANEGLVAVVGTDAPAQTTGADPTRAEASLADEVAMLRTELERLRSEIASRPEASRGISTASAVSASDEANIAALTLPTRGPVSVSPATVDGANLRTAGVALFALVIGWVFGAGFSRRRTRSPRGRLRF